MQILASLDHPNILKLYEVLHDNENFYIITEYLFGGTLKDEISKGPIEEDRAATYMKQIVSAMTYLHSKGIMHRDLKP